MKSANPQFGLVLVGGGAKGAYQVGALQYLAELGLQPQIIAGTSIGALNGAVLASSGEFSQSVHRLSELWKQLAQAEILRPHTGAVLDKLHYAAETFIPTFRHSLIDFLLRTGLAKEKNAFFDPEPIELLLKEAVNPVALRNGTELWVTVFPCLNILGLGCDRLIDLVRAKTGTDVHWLCAQDCADDETLYNLLLASAAIPFAFPQRQVNGKWYIDGGLADNVPLRALAARGCNHAIIIHLNNGVVWNRHDFPEQTVIEIRPEKPINKFNTPIAGTLDTFFDFSAERIADLKQRGYEDARRCLKPIIQTLITVKQQRQINNYLLESTQLLFDDAPL